MTLRYLGMTQLGGRGATGLRFFRATTVEPPPPMSDTFSTGTTVDAAKWPFKAGTITVSGGRAQITPAVVQAFFASNAVFDLTSYGVWIETTALPIAATTTATRFQVGKGANAATFTIDGTPRFLTMAATGISATSIVYDTTAHRWLRFRSLNGTFLWQTSPDGKAWTTRKSAPSPTWVTGDVLAAQARSYLTVDTPDAGFAEFDNFNVKPA